MQNTVITIARGYGSGGKTIGKMLAEDLGTHVYKGELFPPESDEFVSNDNLFNYQAKIIKELASTHSCVIVGRCAF